MKGTPIPYTARQLAFIKRHSNLPRRDLCAKFVRRFPHRRNVSVDNLKRLCERKGWLNGNSGQFRKGAIPANKGKKMPFNANSARTRFKKGNRSGEAERKYKPIGSTRQSKDNYLEQKIHDGLPMQSRWRAVHLINWEKKYGVIPKGHCLKCLDGDKSNVKPSNWDLIPRALLPRLNSRWGKRRYDAAPPEVKPTIMAIAKLEQRLREKPRNQTAKQE
jgi:hypothetical protein